MEIKFYWNGNIVGHTYHLFIDGKEIDLGLYFPTKEVAASKIREILIFDYNLDYVDKEIVFEWGGRL